MTYNKGGYGMRLTVRKFIEDGDMKAAYHAILNDGTKGRGGEDLSSRRAKGAALFARAGLVDPVEIQPQRLEKSGITPDSVAASLQTFQNESRRESSKLAWEKDGYS